MSHRKILYGYTIENGLFTTVPSEVGIVKKIYDWYCDGRSFLSIANRLNSEKVIYWMDSPLWNKHKVKRILENPRFTGRDGYPIIISEEVFSMVQSIISCKGQKARVEHPSLLKLPAPQPNYTYTPTAEVLRNTNQINHGVDHPDQPYEVIELIIQGISIRYKSLTKQE